MFLEEMNYLEIVELFGILPVSDGRSYFYVIKHIDGRIRLGSMSGQKFWAIFKWVGTNNERPTREVYEAE
jgi:hypothetical protein